MNNMKDLNLVEILKGHEGEIFYTSIYGDVKFISIDNDSKYPIEFESITGLPSVIYFTSDGRYTITEGAECLLFPSKEQRDWSKWAMEQKTKEPKTWSKICSNRKDIAMCASIRILTETYSNSPIEKSALALIKIHKLIEVGYGGNIINEEWNNPNIKKWVISIITGGIASIWTYNEKYHIAFHTEEQKNEFLSYPENVQLVKDFYMVP